MVGKRNYLKATITEGRMEFESCRAYKIKGENGLCVGDKRTKKRCSVCPCYIREQAIITEEKKWEEQEDGICHGRRIKKPG